MADGTRRLVILRHAKSAWPDGVPDAERPLNARGRRDAPAAGRWLRDRGEHVDAVVCSPAARTRQTWNLAAAVLSGLPAPVFDDRIYDATADALLTVVSQLPDGAEQAVLVGHNPGVTELVALLTGESPQMRTAAIAVLDLAGSWENAAPGGATLVAHATPRG
ncbi:SixA phosphatase family protein [Pseudonocardia xinjiangensis]|uniref:SixA phosphatase family protein n=1 Tax=Pseudonocardia xinjiangensis TaxID=75289 RepID=UPI003D90C8F2